MRIATWNIDGINRRLPLLLAWLEVTRPDVVALQETKSTDADFPAAALKAAGYDALSVGQRTWNGVALLARGKNLVPVRRELPGDANDTQSRYLEAAIDGVLYACLYAPNGNPRPGPKFDAKLAWMERLRVHAASLAASGLPVVMLGDFNVVPTDADIYPTTSYRGNALLEPAARDAYVALIDQGWNDAVRTLHPDQPMYTFWDRLRNRWSRDAGLRIDHVLLGPALVRRLREAGVDRAMRGQEGASDHAPVWVRLGRR